MEEGFKFTEEMAKQRIDPDINTCNLLLHGLCSMGKVDDAVKLWVECENHGLVANVYTYGVMIEGYCKAGRSEDTEHLLVSW